MYLPVLVSCRKQTVQPSLFCVRKGVEFILIGQWRGNGCKLNGCQDGFAHEFIVSARMLPTAVPRHLFS